MSRDPELVLIQSGSDIFMCMGVNIGIDPDRYPCPQSERRRKGIHDLYLLQGFTVEGPDPEPEGGKYLSVTLPHSGEHYVFRAESAGCSVHDFVAAHAVCSETERTYVSQ